MGGREACSKIRRLGGKGMANLERPYLVFLPTAVDEDAKCLTYTFANYGRAPCEIIHLRINYLPITPLNAPEPLKPNILQAVITPDRVIVPPNGGQCSPRSVPRGKPFVDGAEEARMSMVHGYAIYRSNMGKTYACGFGLYQKDDEGPEWGALTTPAFNYDREVKRGWQPPSPIKVTLKSSPN